MTEYRSRFPSQETLLSRYIYRPDGVLINKYDIASMARAGEVAGFLNKSQNRWHIRVGKADFLRHDIVWIMHRGGIRIGYVINHRRPGREHLLDDRIENLSELPKSLDRLNSRTPRGGSSQYRGVWRRPDGKYTVRIRLFGVRYSLGTFVNELHAAAAYERARRFVEERYSDYWPPDYWRELPPPCQIADNAIGWKRLQRDFGFEPEPEGPSIGDWLDAVPA